jgi:transcriptional regulator with GAF, ATPase, and Fis domain
MVADGKFQEDPFYRLNVIPIEIPPPRSGATTSRRWSSTSSEARAAHRLAVRQDGRQRADGLQCRLVGQRARASNTIERAAVLSPGPVTSRAVSVRACQRSSWPACRR